MDTNTIKERVDLIEKKRESLVRLLQRTDLGTLRIDVNQAIEEIDDLIAEFNDTFPENKDN
jgi:HAMP domain-containing protein